MKILVMFVTGFATFYTFVLLLFTQPWKYGQFTHELGLAVLYAVPGLLALIWFIKKWSKETHKDAVILFLVSPLAALSVSTFILGAITGSFVLVFAPVLALIFIWLTSRSLKS